MKDLQEYIEESLLDNFDDLEAASDKAVNDRILKNHLKITRMSCCGMRVKDLTGLREIKKYIKTSETTRFEVLYKRKPFSLNINSTMKPSPLECLFVDYILNQEDTELIKGINSTNSTGYINGVENLKVIQAIEKLIGPGFNYHIYRSTYIDHTHCYISIEIFDKTRSRYIKLNFQG